MKILKKKKESLIDKVKNFRQKIRFFMVASWIFVVIGLDNESMAFLQHKSPIGIWIFRCLSQ
jgi:hypothetical protein